MKISIIAAMARNRVIGKDNTMPWYLPAELRHFKQVTMGKPIIMGRKTFDSIGRVLPGRRNIVITRDPDYRFEGLVVVHAIEQAWIAADDAEEVMLIGGGHLYQQMINRAERLYLTLIDAVIEGDTYFPEIKNSEWLEIQDVYRPADEKNRYALRFLEFERQ